ncbi:MAG: carbon monoxide dehydrogenase [Acidobacteria bacterium]|nr:MAG: carbon monoxide dehydrogenase [Acidobacteriota bacterium]REK03884.1 MAG: carbon monoxide dehydrogenase [Acidobacteriota bacterium]
MKITGQEHYPHPRERVWRALLDPEILSRTLPGCEDLEQVGENEYAGKLKMKVGPVQGVFQGGVVLSDLRQPEGYRMAIEGKGAPGFMNGNGTLRLEESEGGTLLHYDIDAQVGGRIASVGQRLLDSSAKVITRQGLAGLGRQLDALAERESESTGAAPADAESDRATAASTESAPPRTAAEAAGGDGAATPRKVPTTDRLESERLPDAPSQAEFAREFAREMSKELLPRGARTALVVAGVLLAVALVALYLRACT